MGTSVIDLINQGAKRQGPTTRDIESLASGSTRATTTRTAKKKAATSSSPRAKKSTRTAKPKAACKYGPRDADGRCPKKPSNPRRQTSGNRTKVTARTPTSATTQAIDVVTNPRASKEQKIQAVEKVAESAATSGLKAGAKKVAKSGRVQRGKEIAVNVAKKVPVGGVLGPFVSAASQVLAKMPTEKQLAAAKRARQRADAAVATVEKSLAKKGQKLSKKDRNVLLKQHIDHYLRNP